MIDLSDPQLWHVTGAALADRYAAGHHSTFDLSDRSHATDIVQIVCETIAKVSAP